MIVSRVDCFEACPLIHMKEKIYLRKILSEQERQEKLLLRFWGAVLTLILIIIFSMLFASCEARPGSVPEAFLLGLGGFGLLIVGVSVLRAVMVVRHAEESMQVGAVERKPLVDDLPLVNVAPAVMQWQDLRDILASLTAELCLVSELVRKARADLSVEDYGARLRDAEERLRQAVSCCGALLARLSSEGTNQN